MTNSPATEPEAETTAATAEVVLPALSDASGSIGALPGGTAQ